MNSSVYSKFVNSKAVCKNVVSFLAISFHIFIVIDFILVKKQRSGVQESIFFATLVVKPNYSFRSKIDYSRLSPSCEEIKFFLCYTANSELAN